LDTRRAPAKFRAMVFLMKLLLAAAMGFLMLALL